MDLLGQRQSYVTPIIGMAEVDIKYKNKDIKTEIVIVYANLDTR